MNSPYPVLAGSSIHVGQARKPKGLPASYYAAEGRRNQLERADAVIAAQAERIAREKAAREAMYAPRTMVPSGQKLISVERRTPNPEAVGSIPTWPATRVRVRFLHVALEDREVEASSLRWWSDGFEKPVAYALTRPTAKKRAGDVPYLRKKEDGRWCYRVEILVEGEA
jgi:hypothetical protein